MIFRSFLFIIFFGISSQHIFSQVDSDTESYSKIEVDFHENKSATRNLMLKKGLKSIVSTPVNATKFIANEFSNTSYHELLNNSKNKKSSPSNENKECTLNVLNPTNAENIQSILNALDSCECSPWNDCPGKACSDEVVCPFDLSIFKITSTQNSPIEENQLSFRNHDTNMPYKEMTGFCWGHATVTQRMDTLSLFSPQDKAPHSPGSKEWVEFYKEIIDSIVLHNQARTIPGFASVFELSSSPSFKDYFKNLVSEVWAEYAMNLRAIEDSSDLRQNEKTSNSFYEELNLFMENGVSPVLVRAGGINQLGESHVLIPWRQFEDKKGKFVCLNDNSKKVLENMACENSLRSTKNSASHNFPYHHKRDMIQQAKSLQALCLEKKKQGTVPSVLPVKNKLFLDFIDAKSDTKRMEEIFAKALKEEYGENSDDMLIMSYKELFNTPKWYMDKNFVSSHFKSDRDLDIIVDKRHRKIQERTDYDFYYHNLKKKLYP